MSFNEDGSQVTWREWEYFVWDPSTSFPGADPWNDTVTIVNVPYQAVLGAFQFQSDDTNHWWEALLFDAMASVTNSTLFVTKHPHDIIFGYKVIIKFVKLNSSLLFFLFFQPC